MQNHNPEMCLTAVCVEIARGAHAACDYEAVSACCAVFRRDCCMSIGTTSKGTVVRMWDEDHLKEEVHWLPLVKVRIFSACCSKAATPVIRAALRCSPCLGPHSSPLIVDIRCHVHWLQYSCARNKAFYVPCNSNLSWCSIFKQDFSVFMRLSPSMHSQPCLGFKAKGPRAYVLGPRCCVCIHVRLLMAFYTHSSATDTSIYRHILTTG